MKMSSSSSYSSNSLETSLRARYLSHVPTAPSPFIKKTSNTNLITPDPQNQSHPDIRVTGAHWRSIYLVALINFTRATAARAALASGATATTTTTLSEGEWFRGLAPLMNNSSTVIVEKKNSKPPGKTSSSAVVFVDFGTGPDLTLPFEMKHSSEYDGENDGDNDGDNDSDNGRDQSQEDDAATVLTHGMWCDCASTFSLESEKQLDQGSVHTTSTIPAAPTTAENVFSCFLGLLGKKCLLARVPRVI